MTRCDASPMGELAAFSAADLLRISATASHLGNTVRIALRTWSRKRLSCFAAQSSTCSLVRPLHVAGSYTSSSGSGKIPAPPSFVSPYTGQTAAPIRRTNDRRSGRVQPPLHLLGRLNPRLRSSGIRSSRPREPGPPGRRWGISPLLNATKSSFIARACDAQTALAHLTGPYLAKCPSATRFDSPPCFAAAAVSATVAPSSFFGMQVRSQSPSVPVPGLKVTLLHLNCTSFLSPVKFLKVITMNH